MKQDFYHRDADGNIWCTDKPVSAHYAETYQFVVYNQTFVGHARRNVQVADPEIELARARFEELIR